MNLLLWIFRKIITLGVYAFFNRIEVTGKNLVPKDGPLILCGCDILYLVPSLSLMVQQCLTLVQQSPQYGAGPCVGRTDVW